jgi:hypothetical protein
MIKAPIMAGVLRMQSPSSSLQLDAKFREWCQECDIRPPTIGTTAGWPVCLIFDTEEERSIYLLTWSSPIEELHHPV